MNFRVEGWKKACFNPTGEDLFEVCRQIVILAQSNYNNYESVQKIFP